MDSIGLWRIAGPGPARLQSAEVAAERDLEGWIERDPGLLERGLVIVGQQLWLEGGRLDLLALDPQGRWVLIEIKRERLRREVLSQAIDYASCLHRLSPSLLRERCNGYLKSKPGMVTLDELLEQRGGSLDLKEDGREVVIYLVGTGLDPGLERMAGFLAERAALSLRIVTFSAFRDGQGGILLAREIHESADEPAVVERRVSASSTTSDEVLALADHNGVGGVVRTLYTVATELGLHARLWPKSIMVAPPANRTRCLYAVWVARRHREPGFAKVYIAAEAFEQFYGIKEQDLVAAVGPVGYVMLDQDGAERVSAGLRLLMAAKEVGESGTCSGVGTT